MANRWSGVTIDCADPVQMSTFWAAVLGIPASNEHGDDPNWATVGSRSAPLPRLTFQRVPEPKAGKVRVHLDARCYTLNRNSTKCRCQTTSLVEDDDAAIFRSRFESFVPGP